MRTPLLSRSAMAAALLLSTLGLASCGYSPLYAPGAGAAGAAEKVQIGEVTMENPERNVGQRRPAQKVYQELKLNFPNNSADMDTVTVSIHEDTDTLAVERTAAVQRAQIYLRATIVLADAGSHNLLKTSLYTTAPYNVEETPYSTETGKTYARLTAAQNLADEISRRLYLYYSTHKNTGNVKPGVPQSASNTVPQAPILYRPNKASW